MALNSNSMLMRLVAQPQPVAVQVDIKLPSLGVLEVGKMQEHHEGVSGPVFLLPFVAEHCAIAGCCNSRLENSQRLDECWVWLDAGLLSRQVPPLWADFIPPVTVV